MEFSGEQQAFIDNMINKRVAEVRTAAEAKAKEEVATAEAKFKEASVAKDKELADLKAKAESGGKGSDVDLTAMKAKLEELLAERKENLELARKSQLIAAASDLNAISAEQVAMLVSPHISGEKTLTILGLEGKPRANDKGDPMTVKEYMAEFLATNPHLVKASGSQGAGSQGSKGNEQSGAKTMKRAAYDKLSPLAQKTFALTPGNAITD